MFPLPQLPSRADLTWRPWTAADAEAMARHTLLIHEAEHLDHVPGPSFYEWMAQQEGFDAATDSIAGFRGDDVVADAGVWTHAGDGGGRCFIWTEVQPGYHDLEPTLIEWAEQRARQRLAGLPGDGDRIIRFPVGDHRTRLRSALQERGFEVARSFATMRRALVDLPDLGPVPADHAIVPWSPEIDEEFRLVSNASFADHWGSLPFTPEGWKGMTIDSPIFRGDMTFGMRSPEGDLVSICIVELDEDDEATRGFREIYIHRVGTLASHRQRRLASHLMLTSMRAGVEDGATSAGLDVDESSHTNATVVYERLGFEVVERTVHYLKKVLKV